MNHQHRAARQYSDQYHCSYCGKQWDVNDPDPPRCEISLVDSLDLMCNELEPAVKTTPAEHIKKLRGIVENG